MSKWLNDSDFESFIEEKKHEQEARTKEAGPRRTDIIWQTPERGTSDSPNDYELRFLPSPKGKPYRKIYYHMSQNPATNRWTFILCPKTHNFENYCPLCSATSKLYMGDKEDKKMADNYKRKIKYVSNIFVIDDFRDAKRAKDDLTPFTGRVLVYEFPGKVESKLAQELVDRKHGLGPAIFDPGPNGYNFLLRVGATKPSGAQKKVFPNYDDSKFIPRPSALGTDNEIEKIMEQRHDLDEYIGSMERDNDFLKGFLQTEMLWEMIKGEWDKYIEAIPEVTEGSRSALDEMDDLPSSFNKDEDTSKESDDTPPFDLDEEDDEETRKLMNDLMGVTK